jgi:acetyl-CoA carboxylase biotin carboxylase subunit
MIKRVFVANRGEIAVRVVRACRELGIETVVPYSESDAGSLATILADQAICIGPGGPARRSYLDVPSILAAAQGTGANAIHPGYGFLAENADFAAACVDAGLIFVGPSADAISRMGDKIAGRRTVIAAGVPVVPGSDDPIADAAEAQALAIEIGPPVLLKAKAGGGGRGMRIVEDVSQVSAAFEEASREAAAAFGDGSLYVERYLAKVRHVEIQIMADTHGNVIYLGERDCSVQRRHQKLIEEGPSPAVDADLRRRMGEAAVAGARAVDYVGAGTVEFLLDANNGEYHFIEMNTRIQVEHPVTEALTGVDLVAEQLRVAGGETLSISQEQVSPTGHAIECRINAEDPAQGFAPMPGVITAYRAPGGPGVRVDSHCFEGYRMPPDYDSLLAKVIVHAANRDQARRRMRRALDEMVIEGIATTIPFHRAVMEDPEFASGEVTTDYLERRLDDLVGG